MPPCETKTGCKKGHWTDQVRVRDRFMALLRLYDAVKATSGACLTEEQKRDQLLINALASIDTINRHGERMMLAGMVRNSVVASISMLKGGS